MGRVVYYLSERRGGRADEKSERCEEHWGLERVGGIDEGCGGLVLWTAQKRKEGMAG